MSEKSVLEHLGAPTDTRMYSLVGPPKGTPGMPIRPGTIDEVVADVEIRTPPGDTTVVRHGVWENVQTWPWPLQSKRTWQVIFVERAGVWRVHESNDLSDGVVVG